MGMIAKLLGLMLSLFLFGCQADNVKDQSKKRTNIAKDVPELEDVHDEEVNFDSDFRVINGRTSLRFERGTTSENFRVRLKTHPNFSNHLNDSDAVVIASDAVVAVELYRDSVLDSGELLKGFSFAQGLVNVDSQDAALLIITEPGTEKEDHFYAEKDALDFAEEGGQLALAESTVASIAGLKLTNFVAAFVSRSSLSDEFLTGWKSFNPLTVVTKGGKKPAATEESTSNSGTAELTSVSPARGTTSGGTNLTLIGKNFANTFKIKIDNVECSQQAVVSRTKITCVTPAHSGTGAVDVSVHDANSEMGRLKSGFEYLQGDRWTALPAYSLAKIKNGHSVIWTGEEAIMWGGARLSDETRVSSGVAYNPKTKQWRTIADTSGLSGRYGHSAVWTGSKMIVWGGLGSSVALDDGAAYDPATDTWTSLTLTDKPAARYQHQAIWTGSKMFVFGGKNQEGIFPSTHAMYDPASDKWTAVDPSNGFAGRENFTMSWNGESMFIWGGSSSSSTQLNDGALYFPATGEWRSVLIFGAPTARYLPTSVWTGTEFVLWGGAAPGAPSQSGGRYNPATARWYPTSLTDAPSARYHHSSVWANNRMMIWGGDGLSGKVATGGSYDPATDDWTPIGHGDVMSPRWLHKAVWTGSEMIVMGGETTSVQSEGGVYVP